MRNLKKVLTLVLTLAMLLSVMVVGAGAATFGDQDSITNKEAVDVCTTLNIIGGYEDGTFRPAGNVTRAEMCKMICVALNGGKEPTLGSNSVNTFNDVASDNWAKPYIEYCVSEGIVGGVGGGNFNPGGNITGTQAAKMLLCILGYNASLQGYVGNDSWEMKINVDASQKHLYDGIIGIDASAPLTRDQAAQMIWNALQAYEVEYVNTLVTGPDGSLISKATVRDKVVGENLDKITLLTDKYEARTYVGYFDGNAEMFNLRDGHIQVSSKPYTVEVPDGLGGTTTTIVTDTPNFPYDMDMKYIGEEVKVLYKDNTIEGNRYQPDMKDTIYGVYVTGVSTVYNTNKDAIQDVDNKNIKFNDVKHAYEADTGLATSIMINYGGKDAVALTKTNIETNWVDVTSGDPIKLVDRDGDGKIDHAYVTESSINKVSATNASKVTLSTIGTIDRDGNQLYDGIATGDVVVATQLYETDKADATFAVTKADTVSGTVKSFYASEKVTIDGTTYFLDDTELTGANKVMAELTDNAIAKFARANLENTATLYLINGFVGAADSSATETYYGLITAASNMDKVGHAISGAKVQLLTLDGKNIFDVDSDSKNAVTNAGIVDGNGNGTADDEWAKQLVKYSKVSDTSIEIKSVIDNVVKLNTSDGSAVASSTGVSVYDKDTKSLATKGTGYDGTSDFTTKSTVVDSGAVFFTSTDLENGQGTNYKAYNMRSLGDINTGNAVVSVNYVIDADTGMVVAAYADLGYRPSGASSSAKFGIITDLNRDVRIDGTYYNQYTVWTGEETTIYANKGASGDFNKGDLIYFEQTADNLYGANEVKALNGADFGNTFASDGKMKAIPVLAVKYEKNDNDNGGILRYRENFGASQSSIALDSNLQIVYVNVADKKAGDDFGKDVPKFDDVTGYKNVMIVDIDKDGKYDAIIVDANGDILNVANDSSKVAHKLTLAAGSNAVTTTSAGTYSLTVTPAFDEATTAPTIDHVKLKDTRGITVTVTPTNPVQSGSDTVTVTLAWTDGGSQTATKTVTFNSSGENQNAANAQSVTFTMPNFDAEISGSVAHS